VNGPLYSDVVQGKDLIADVLPPPAYIIESFLLVLRMQEETETVRIEELARRLRDLRKEYDERHTFWTQDLAEGDVKTLFLKDSYRPAMEFFDATEREYVPAILRRDLVAAQRIVRERLAPSYEAHRQAIDRVVELTKQRNQRTEEQAAAFISSRTFGLVAFGVAMAAVGVGLSWLVAISITRPITRVVALLRRIASGDLTEAIVVDREDELGDVLRSASDMSAALRSAIGEIKTGSNAVASAMSQINASSRRNVETSETQLNAIQVTTTSATELQETARVAGERAREIQSTLRATSESGQAINVELGDATGLLARAREELQTIVGSVQQLSNRNQQIGEIIESVADVADQTQLLAVNAAIEAAKAGEVGRGFGVVATEMKALAEQSKKAAQKIRGIVGEVQRATTDTAQLVSIGQTRLQDALDPVTAILPKVEKLTAQVDESGQSGRQIIAIVAQQGAGIEQISQAMKAIQGGVQEGLAQTQQVDRAAESMTVLAAKLRDIAATYRV
jgi:methyl-accepting chemotaxis protein